MATARPKPQPVGDAARAAMGLPSLRAPRETHLDQALSVVKGTKAEKPIVSKLVQQAPIAAPRSKKAKQREEMLPPVKPAKTKTPKQSKGKQARKNGLDDTPVKTLREVLEVLRAHSRVAGTRAARRVIGVVEKEIAARGEK